MPAADSMQRMTCRRRCSSVAAPPHARTARAICRAQPPSPERSPATGSAITAPPAAVAKWTSTARRTLSAIVLRPSARVEERGVLRVGDIAGLEQDRRHVGRLQHHQRRHAVEVRLDRDQRLRLAAEQPGEACADAFIVSRWVRSIRIDETSALGVAEVDAGDDVGLVLARRQPRGFLVGRDFGQRVDRRAASRRAIADAVAMDRDEQVAPSAAARCRSARCRTRKRSSSRVSATRTRPEASSVVADRPGDPERHILLAQPAVGRDRAGIVRRHARRRSPPAGGVVVALDLAAARSARAARRHRHRHAVAVARDGRAIAERRQEAQPALGRGARRNAASSTGAQLERQRAAVAAEACLR